MDNLREKLIAIIDDCRTYVAKKEELADHLIDNGVTVQKWIPVTERLPEVGEVVLIFCKIGKMFVGYCRRLYSGRFVWKILTARDSTKEVTYIITHWMPLPEAPEEDGNGK